MASRGKNLVIILGNPGNDAETNFLPSGGSVTNISVATSESWKDKNTGQQQERTEWHRVVFFNRLAEIAGEYLRKGSKVYVEGSLRTRKWQDKNTGQDRYTTEIVGSEMQMLDGRSENDQGGYQQPTQQQSRQPAQQPQQQGYQQPAQRPAQQPASSPAASSDNGAFSDDLPFVSKGYEGAYSSLVYVV